MESERAATLPLNGLSRSKSFAGILAPRRPGASTLGRESSSTNKRSSWFGSGMMASGSNSGSTLSLNSKTRSSVKVSAREPRPERTRLVMSAVINGIHEAIAVTEEDIANLKASLQGLTAQSQQQLKAAERYLKRLDCQLSAVEELQEAYAVQSRLREGVRAMGKAYVESLGPEREAALANVRTGFKECNDVMCALEAQLESLVGAFHIQMKGLLGFARLCPGDVFEITLRHGQQKWRTRGKIGRDGTQTWESHKFVFKSLIEDVLFIRASEIRSLGKQVVLGNKYCDTLDLYCAQSQMMTVNLNTSGTLKLNLIVTWDPLYGIVEENGMPVKQQITNSPAHRPRSLATNNSHSPTGTLSSSAAAESVTALSMGSLESEGTASPDHDSGKNSTLDSTSPMNELHELISTLREEDELKDNQSYPSPDYSADEDDYETATHKEGPDNHYENVAEVQRSITVTAVDVHSSSSGETATGKYLRQSNTDSSGNFLLVRRTEDADSDSWWPKRQGYTADSGYGGSVHAGRSRSSQCHGFTEEDEFDTEEFDQSPPSVEKKNTETVEDWRASHDKQSLDAIVQHLHGLIDDIQGQYAELELFERNVSSLFELVQRNWHENGSNSSLVSLTVESALECFSFLEEEEEEGNDVKTSRGSSRPVTPCPLQRKPLFSAQLDAALESHLLYSTWLMQNLGSFGPLKIKERQSLTKLQLQGRILGKLLKLVDKQLTDQSCTSSGLDELDGLPHLQKLWSNLSPGGHALVIPSEDIVSRLMPLCRASLSHFSSEMHQKVMRQFVNYCLDVESYDPSCHVTVFQFRYFVRSKERSFQTRLEEIAEEVSLVEALGTDQPTTVQKTITRLSLVGPVPTKVVLWKMAHLLLDHSDHSNNPRLLVASYLKNNAKDVFHKQKVFFQLVDSYLEALELGREKDREAACEALGVLHALETVDQLAYVAQSDPSKSVQDRARRALQALGDEGRQVLQQLQLSSHGFQGLSVK